MPTQPHASLLAVGAAAILLVMVAVAGRPAGTAAEPQLVRGVPISATSGMPVVSPGSPYIARIGYGTEGDESWHDYWIVYDVQCSDGTWIHEAKVFESLSYDKVLEKDGSGHVQLRLQPKSSLKELLPYTVRYYVRNADGRGWANGRFTIQK